MFPNFIKNHSIRSGKGSSTDVSPKNDTSPNSGSASRTSASMNDFMTKSGQFFTSIQGTLDKQLGQIVEAVQSATTFDAVELSVIPVVTRSEFDPYLSLVQDQWDEYKGIVSSFGVVREKSGVEEGVAVGAFREIPQVFFNTDYKESGFVQHQIFTQPLRVSLQTQGKINSQLSRYLKSVDSHLVRHLSNVDSLLRSLMTIATIQSDVAAAHDRVVSIRKGILANKEIVTGLHVHNLSRRRSRLLLLLSLLEEVDKVSQAKPGVDAFVANGDFATGMELIQATQNILVTKLNGLKMTQRIASVIQDHGRHIDGDMETEFLQLVMASFDNSTPVLPIMLKSMAERSLLIPCIQMRLRDALVIRLKELMDPASTLADMFLALKTFLTRVGEFVLLVDLRGRRTGDDPILQRLTCLRMYECVASNGLARISHFLVTLVEGENLLSLEKIVELKIAEFEQMYFSLFAETLGLGEHVSFASSIIGAGSSHSGVSPDVFAALFRLGGVKLLQLDERAISYLSAQFAEERWDKSLAPEQDVLDFIKSLENDEDLEQSPLSGPRAVCVGRVNYLLVPAGLALLQILGSYYDLLLVCPELDRVIERIRWVNQQIRESVLEGKMGVTFKKPINATNLALASQVLGLAAQVALLVAKKVSERFAIDTGLVVLDEAPVSRHAVNLPVVEEYVSELAQGVVMDLNDHRMEIFFKLSDILISRFEYHLAKWCTCSDNSPLEGIVKDFSQMYKVLLKSLQTDNLKRVFARAFNESTHRFRTKVDGSQRALPADLLFLYQAFLAAEAMSGLHSSLASMTEDMLDIVDNKDEASVKLRELLCEKD